MDLECLEKTLQVIGQNNATRNANIDGEIVYKYLQSEILTYLVDGQIQNDLG